MFVRTLNTPLLSLLSFCKINPKKSLPRKKSLRKKQQQKNKKQTEKKKQNKIIFVRDFDYYYCVNIYKRRIYLANVYKRRILVFLYSSKQYSNLVAVDYRLNNQCLRSLGTNRYNILLRFAIQFFQHALIQLNQHMNFDICR